MIVYIAFAVKTNFRPTIKNEYINTGDQKIYVYKKKSMNNKTFLIFLQILQLQLYRKLKYMKLLKTKNKDNNATKNVKRLTLYHCDSILSLFLF